MILPKHKNIEDKAESTKSNYIQSFDTRSEEILRRKLAGERNQDIAKAMQLSENRVSFIVTSPIFQARMTARQESINKKFEQELAIDPIKRKFQLASDKASDVLINIMEEAPLGALKKSAANDILEYAGQTKKPGEDHSTKIYIDKRTGNDIRIAVKALKMDVDLLKEIGIEGVVTEVESTSGDKPESVSGVGKKELLDILQGDNEEQLVDEGSTPTSM